MVKENSGISRENWTEGEKSQGISKKGQGGGREWEKGRGKYCEGGGMSLGNYEFKEFGVFLES